MEVCWIPFTVLFKQLTMSADLSEYVHMDAGKLQHLAWATYTRSYIYNGKLFRDRMYQTSLRLIVMATAWLWSSYWEMLPYINVNRMHLALPTITITATAPDPFKRRSCCFALIY
jgi:hypothetical protein